MADPFTIRIFVPDGDPDGVRFIDRMNWTGMDIAFPRDKWPETKHRSEFTKTGIYILVGYAEENDDLPALYIGQGDGLRNRIESHYHDKDFWDWGIAFVSTGSGLNRAHITWLEYALIDRAVRANRSHLENANAPTEPALSEPEKADTRAFLEEIVQILPLVGLRAFEAPKAIGGDPMPSGGIDTIVVPAQQEGFESVFLGENCWYAIRIAGGKIPNIKYIAGYQTRPISAITHYAPVDHIEPYGEGGKYKVVFSEPAKKIGPIPYGDAPSGFMQGPRYTSLAKLKAAKKLTDILVTDHPYNLAVTLLSPRCHSGAAGRSLGNVVSDPLGIGFGAVH